MGSARVTTATAPARRWAGRLEDERGTALAEFIIVAPVLLAIIFAILYFGRFENYTLDEQHMADVAVRYGAVNFDPSSSQTIQNYVLSQAPGELQSGSGDVPSPAKVYIYFPSGSANTVGDPVTACVQATVHFIPLLGIANQTITQSATMRLEQAQTSSVWTPDTSIPAGCPAS